MNKIIWNTVTHKPTGKRYRYHIKVSWGVKYYSFDYDQATWHKTRTEAFNHAKETNNLCQLHSRTEIDGRTDRINESLRISEINGWPKGDY
jgi:hypothetical protein